jgi:hypothetical protein
MPRTSSKFLRIPLLALALTAATLHAQDIAATFKTPPPDARPMVRWWWFGPAVVKPEILRELQQMKADGIGGAELAFVYPEELDNPAKDIHNLTFLSKEMLEAVTYAQSEGRRLGLRIDVTLCSGWPYGGPATTLGEAATRLRTAQVPLPAGATSARPPALQEGESILSTSVVDLLANPPAAPPPGPRGPRGPGPITWNPATAKLAAAASIPASDHPRIALFFIQSHTRQQVKRAAVGAEGWVLDPFSKAAVATHLKAVGEPLLSAFGSTPPYAIFSDSLEAFGADWTPNLPAEFMRRRGYDLLPHLPELVAGGSLAAENVRHDYGVTLTELVNENYLTQINDWALAHGTKFRSQTYHDPAVSFSSQNLTGLIEGEGPQWRAFSTLRWATSAGHVYNRNVISGETFTWLHSPVFRATPLDMKTEADIDFLMGENQLVFHGWPYSPPQAFYPGWSLYAAASLNDNNPWHPVMPAVTAYISRISALLRQGEPANQVAILLPTDDVWAGFRPAAVSVSGVMGEHITGALMSAILSAGYNIDYIDAEAIDKVGLGTHQIVVLPPTDRIPVSTLRKLDAWSKAGGKVIALGHLPTMTPDGKSPPEIAELTKFIILIPDTDQLPKALHNSAKPDLQLAADTDQNTRDQIGFIRRKTPTADIYFIANTSNQTVHATATVATQQNVGYELNTDTGVAIPAMAFPGDIHLTLSPYESKVFVFNQASLLSVGIVPPVPLSPVTDLSTNWKVAFTGTPKTTTETTLTDWLADPATKNFSGEAVYTRDFTLPAATGPVYLQVDGGTALPGSPNSRPEAPVLGANGLPNPLVTRTGPGMHAYYDPPVREGALVFINGQSAGALWHPPYRLDVTKLLKPGQNHIEVRVYNTALNAWAALPPHDYKPLIAKYGDRFQMQDLNRVEPISSGILGQIHLVTEAK